MSLAWCIAFLVIFPPVWIDYSCFVMPLKTLWFVRSFRLTTYYYLFLLGFWLQVCQQFGLLRLDVEFRIAGGRPSFDALHLWNHWSAGLSSIGQDHWHTWTSASHQFLSRIRWSGLHLHYILSSKYQKSFFLFLCFLSRKLMTQF